MLMPAALKEALADLLRFPAAQLQAFGKGKEYSMECIRVSGLSKEYRIASKEDGILGSLKHLFCPQYEIKEAVKEISFVIEKGESVAFLGANGAGKSTTIKMLTGIMKPDSGSIEIMGRNPFTCRMEHAKKIGVVFGQKTQLWWDIPVIETFRLLKDVYEVPDGRYEKNMKEFCRILNLQEFLHQPARKLSLGQRVRADLAASLLHEPPLLFLDEPTIGLDAAVRQNIYEFLIKINREKQTTILLTSHDMKDLETLCRRLIVMEKGSILFDGDIDKIFGYFEDGSSLEEIAVRLFQRGNV